MHMIYPTLPQGKGLPPSHRSEFQHIAKFWARFRNSGYRMEDDIYLADKKGRTALRTRPFLSKWSKHARTQMQP